MVVVSMDTAEAAGSADPVELLKLHHVCCLSRCRWSAGSHVPVRACLGQTRDAWSLGIVVKVIPHAPNSRVQAVMMSEVLPDGTVDSPPIRVWFCDGYWQHAKDLVREKDVLCFWSPTVVVFMGDYLLSGQGIMVVVDRSEPGRAALFRRTGRPGCRACRPHPAARAHTTTAAPLTAASVAEPEPEPEPGSEPEPAQTAEPRTVADESHAGPNSPSAVQPADEASPAASIPDSPVLPAAAAEFMLRVPASDPANPYTLLSAVGRDDPDLRRRPHVMGVIVVVPQPARRTRRGLMVMVAVKDPSCCVDASPRHDLVVFVFVRSSAELPDATPDYGFQVGNVLRVRHVKIERRNGKLDGRVFQGSAVTVFSSGVDEPLAPLGTPAGATPLTDAERARLVWLRRWWRHQRRWQAVLDSATDSTIGDLLLPGLYHLHCEVVCLTDAVGRHPAYLQVRDGSRGQALFVEPRPAPDSGASSSRSPETQLLRHSAHSLHVRVTDQRCVAALQQLVAAQQLRYVQLLRVRVASAPVDSETEALEVELRPTDEPLVLQLDAESAAVTHIRQRLESVYAAERTSPVSPGGQATPTERGQAAAASTQLGQVAAAPSQPGQEMVSPGQPGQEVVSPGQPGQEVVSPGQSGQEMVSPAQPRKEMVSPGQPGQEVVSPGQPGQEVVSPGQPGQERVALVQSRQEAGTGTEATSVLAATKRVLENSTPGLVEKVPALMPRVSGHTHPERAAHTDRPESPRTRGTCASYELVGEHISLLGTQQSSQETNIEGFVTAPQSPSAAPACPEPSATTAASPHTPTPAASPQPTAAPATSPQPAAAAAAAGSSPPVLIVLDTRLPRCSLRQLADRPAGQPCQIQCRVQCGRLATAPGGLLDLLSAICMRCDIQFSGDALPAVHLSPALELEHHCPRCRQPIPLVLTLPLRLRAARGRLRLPALLTGDPAERLVGAPVRPSALPALWSRVRRVADALAGWPLAQVGLLPCALPDGQRQYLVVDTALAAAADGAD